MALFRCGAPLFNYDLNAGSGLFVGNPSTPVTLPTTLSSSYGQGGVINVHGYASLSFSVFYGSGAWGVKSNGEIEAIPTTDAQANTFNVTDYELFIFSSTQAAGWTPTISLS